MNKKISELLMDVPYSKIEFEITLDKDNYNKNKSLLYFSIKNNPKIEEYSKTSDYCKVLISKCYLETIDFTNHVVSRKDNDIYKNCLIMASKHFKETYNSQKHVFSKKGNKKLKDLMIIINAGAINDYINPVIHNDYNGEIINFLEKIYLKGDSAYIEKCFVEYYDLMYDKYGPIITKQKEHNKEERERRRIMYGKNNKTSS